MSRWPSVPLGELLWPNTDRIQLDPDQTYAQVTARLWGKGLALRGRVKGSEIAAAQQNRVSTNQFVISKIDARHGAFGIVPAELDGAVVSNDFPAFNVDPDKALPEFVAWVARTGWFIAICKSASEGSTNRVRLKESRFLAQSIPLPTTTEQQAIVNRLDQAAAAIAARGNAATAMVSEVEATMRAAFARIIADAPRVTMGEIAPLVRRPVVIDPAQVYREIGVRSFYRGLFERRQVLGSDFDWQKLFWVEQGDLVFSNLMAWEQATGLAQSSHAGAVGNHRMLTCQADSSRMSPEFLYYYFTTEDGHREVLKASPGTMVRNKTLSTKLLPKISVPVPSLDAQLWFDSLQSKARAAKATQAEATAHLDQLLPALLNEVFG
ncbi:Type I restriction modification DNA specificity domain protein [Sphingobium herbicidovorans NBRC 16415]|uniref:Type I restriction modification DNA specificity domain protein n=1 Tax=Sphingobium herbicidovorans (strain ATCC 700291 / DSM 11019 / CCUG 56400 / KCTC 2939 / LMG 18315 / NBRC 16415 / MH) TaxID=1219045 RepID=A0A086P925_SPHHM|nr:Type I restriction modification DNA specificity domain protein [Sphingobium herbicidovorans NBRC 16415]